MKKPSVLMTMHAIREVLWPGGDTEADWSADTADQVARIMIYAGYGPSSMKKRAVKRSKKRRK